MSDLEAAVLVLGGGIYSLTVFPVIDRLHLAARTYGSEAAMTILDLPFPLRHCVFLAWPAYVLWLRRFK